MSKSDVRIVSHLELVNWMEDPQALPPKCDAEKWQSEHAYANQNKVSFSGFIWQAKWWSYNEKPQDENWGVWKKLNACR
ncbi:hypothetical protein [Vibrio hibernica]|uniref:hypothetical protein n=1 Tax=Vibrio hibernica TaxID=2587465 RepID=UPI0018824F52|nr:hypothetical protein [Vibrio hibernica]